MITMILLARSDPCALRDPADVGAQPELGLWSEWGRRRSVVDSLRPVYDWPHLRAAAGHRLPQPVPTDQVSPTPALLPKRPTPNSRAEPMWSASGLRTNLARLSDGRSSMAAWLSVVRGRGATRVAATRWRRATGFAVPLLTLLLLPAMGLAYHVYFDRSGLPDLEPFIRFEPPTIGQVYDAKGTVLVELATGVPSSRLLRRGAPRSPTTPSCRPRTSTSSTTPASTTGPCLECCRRRRGAPWPRREPATPGSGCGSATGARRSRSSSSAATSSTTVTSREDAAVLVRRGLAPRLLSVAPGRPGTNKLLRKLEEVRLALWLEEEMRRRYGSTERPSARSSHATPASSTWATAATASPRAASTTSASRSRATGLRTLARPQCWPGS